MLAWYTCIALQRLNGSPKKVKGKLEQLFHVSHADSVMDRLPSQQNPPHGDGKSDFQKTARCHRASLSFQGMVLDG